MEIGGQSFSPQSNQMAIKSNPSQIQPSKKMIVSDEHLEDKERDVFNPTLYSFLDLYQLI
jgi:hypothetical protein